MSLTVSPRKAPRDEIRDILKRLFWNFDKITVTRLNPGYSGASVYKVTPDLGIALARPVIVKIGLKEKIQEEERNYNNYVKWLSGMRSTILLASAYSNRLGGIVYSLIGNPMSGRILSFGDYYKNNNNTTTIERGVERLFNETCEYWYLRITVESEFTLDVYKKELSLNIYKIKPTYEGLFNQFIIKCKK